MYRPANDPGLQMIPGPEMVSLSVRKNVINSRIWTVDLNFTCFLFFLITT